MSLANDLNKIDTDLKQVKTDTNTALSEKGGTGVSTLSDIPMAIKEIPSGGFYPVEDETEPTKEITPNVLHRWGEVATLKVTFASEKAGITNEYVFEFKSGTAPTQLTVPESVRWVSAPNIEANKTYQVSVLNGIGVICGA